MELNGAQIVLEVLREYSVDTVFGYPGNAVLDIYDALCDYPDIRHIMTAHEQGAAHAADGYARSSGKTGVVIATSGPGATNLVTGIATAYMDSSPLVAITGNVCKSMLGHDGFQEVDIYGITLPITKHSFIVSSVETLADNLRDAFRIASSGRKGPVLVDIPMDILCAFTDFEHKTPAQPDPDPEICAEDIQAAVQMIEAAQKPLLFIGGGVVSSGAEAELMALAQKADIPVVSSLMGLSAIPYVHPLFLGMAGKFGHEAANFALKECDLLIATGTRFSDRSADPDSDFAEKAKIIHIDIDSAEMDKNIPSQLHIRSDIRSALARIEQSLPDIHGREWAYTVNGIKNSHASEAPENAMPREIINEIYNSVGSNGIIVTDVGQHQMWTAKYYPFVTPRSFLTSGGLGTMGFGLGAAIGAKIAFPDRPVVLVTGDGSFHMNCGELATVKKYDLPIKIVIMNNTVLGMVRQMQWFKYGRFSMTEPEWETDFLSLVRSYGIDALKIKKSSQIKRRISLALKAKGPVVVDCKIPSNAIVTSN
ncbi:MAG: biosynthetic-type acetolactate synthase large subunit [Clostridiales bacterium]|nr:biosynthetic-type acetolactate synthase large subunit [Clostridiales bacterium]